MASPAATAVAAPDPTVSEYPEDPSFEPNLDGRIEMNQDEVDAIIRNKRKVRDPKACYACHRRKVKCNRELPCDSCVKRDHPELCSYERPTKRRRIALTTQQSRGDSEEDTKEPAMQTGPNVTVPREQWERINAELQQLREHVAAEEQQQSSGLPLHLEADESNLTGTISRSDDATDREGIHAPSNQMGTMHLGARSVLAYMMGLGRTKSTQDNARGILEENILPKLGLDNESVTYPFVDLWSTDNSIKDINGLCSAIPDDQLCRDFFYAYRDVACTIYPVVPDTDEFEQTLEYMLESRARYQRDNVKLDQTMPLGISLSYLALVFAVMASGAQCTSLRAKERELTSQVYICCSYQALRMANFMTHPSLETIEASLIIANVLSYNMNPGVAYIFLGMVIRMSFSMGLQINMGHAHDRETWLRRRVWWALAWQDSHFSVSYDRPTSTVFASTEMPYGPNTRPGNRSYPESMYAIIRLTQEVIRERTLHPRATMSWNTIKRYKDQLASIIADATPHLRERALCYKTSQHLERAAIQLHSSYLTSELCRPALKELPEHRHHPADSPPMSGRRKGSFNAPHSPSVQDATLRDSLRRDCVNALESSVAAYVDVHAISEFAARSWIGIQRAISAAFMLGTLPESNQEPRVLTLLRKLEQCIAERTTEDPAFESAGAIQAHSPENESAPPLTDSPHWARSMAKSLNALGKLNATLAGYKAGVPNQNRYTTSYAGMAMPSAKATSGRLQYPLPPMNTMKQEPYSPTPASVQAMAGQGLGPYTPDSTGSSGDWNYATLMERSAEYVQPPMWG